MNPTQILSIDDPFRAAYLLRFGQYKSSEIKAGRRRYLIQGDPQVLAEENYRYRTGYAMVNPLLLKESFDLLMELSRVEKAKPSGEEKQGNEAFIDLLGDDEEEMEAIDILSDDLSEELTELGSIDFEEDKT